MRSLVFILSLFFLLTSCTIYTKYPGQSGALTNLKFLPTEKDVDVFFVNESKPSKDYIRIALVEKRMAATRTRAGQLLEAVRSESRHLGADAVIILKQNTEQAASYQYESLPSQIMTGIAIRYVDNVELADDQLSHLAVTSHSNGLTEEAKVGYNGELASDFKNMEAFIAYEYSLHYLLESTENWRFQNSVTKKGIIINRRQIDSQEYIASLRAVQHENERYSEIKIMLLRKQPKNITMELEYNSSNQVAKRKWTDKNHLPPFSGYYEAISTYDDAGRLKEEQYYFQAVTESTLKPFATIKYHYYDQNNIEEMLKDEQIIRVKD